MKWTIAVEVIRGWLGQTPRFEIADAKIMEEKTAGHLSSLNCDLLKFENDG